MAKKTGDPKPRRTERVNESLRYDFTREELLDLGRKLARSNSDAQAAEERKKDVDAQLKAEIERHYAESQDLSRRVNNGYEMRDVPCDRIYDFVLGTVTTVRVDTDEVVFERQMRPDERQMELPVGAE